MVLEAELARRKTEGAACEREEARFAGEGAEPTRDARKLYITDNTSLAISPVVRRRNSTAADLMA